MELHVVKNFELLKNCWESNRSILYYTVYTTDDGKLYWTHFWTLVVCDISPYSPGMNLRCPQATYIPPSVISSGVPTNPPSTVNNLKLWLLIIIIWGNTNSCIDMFCQTLLMTYRKPCQELTKYGINQPIISNLEGFEQNQNPEIL